MRRLRFLLAGPALLFLTPSASDGAIFPCDEAGFDQAVATSEGGDPGPHGFACAPEDLPLVLTGQRVLEADLTIDGEGPLVIQGLDFVSPLLTSVAPVLDLRNLALVDPVIGGLVELQLSNARVSGHGHLGTTRVVLHDSAVSDFHHDVASLISGPTNGSAFIPGSIEIVASEISSSSTPNALVEARGGDLLLVGSTVRDNEAFWIVAAGDEGTIEGTTISGNQAITPVLADFGTTIENSTISGNSQQFVEGVDPAILALLAVGIKGCPTVRNSTIAGNTGLYGSHSYGDAETAWSGLVGVCSDAQWGGIPAVFENSILDGTCAQFDLDVRPRSRSPTAGTSRPAATPAASPTRPIRSRWRPPRWR